MNRDAFIELLARLVVDGFITEDEAGALLAQFDAGTLPAQWELPLVNGVRKHDTAIEDIALGALLAWLLGQGRQLTLYPQLTLISLSDALQGRFDERVLTLAERYGDGRLALAGWQSETLAAVEEHIIQQMMLANGRESLTNSQRRELDAIMLEQSAFLQRFADEAALRRGQDAPLSTEQMANRAALYGGVGRAAFYRASEGRLGDGYVIYYRARDDRGTCEPCHNAQGYYRQGQGPMPGEVCLGRGRCRCRREVQYRPRIAQQFRQDPTLFHIR